MSAAEKSSRKMSFYIIGLIFAVWLYSLWADRVTPMTSEARVHTYIVRVAAEVAGNITEVNVKDNQVVEAGDPLFQIDPRNYQLALQAAQANLELAGAKYRRQHCRGRSRSG